MLVILLPAGVVIALTLLIALAVARRSHRRAMVVGAAGTVLAVTWAVGTYISLTQSS